jgi:uncharacterized membrane protein YdjX (TVP38/TMEM64 family)
MRRRPLVIAVGVVALLAVLVALRRSLGLEFEADSVRRVVDGLGIWAPLAFVGIVAFRVPLGMPSAFVLMGGGLVFGTLEGTLYGAAGLLVSALVVFLSSRWAGRDAVEARVPARFRHLLDVAGSRVGALFIAVGTAYPLSPITSYHLLAGVTGMALPVFAASAGTGSLGRAALYTYFGSSLVDAEPGQLVLAGVLIVLALLVPLAFPAPRAWLLQSFERREPS